jgi:hypothetical protein
MPKAFPIEFRRGVVAVAHKGEAPLAIGGGVRPGMTSRPHGKVRTVRRPG